MKKYLLFLLSIPMFSFSQVNCDTVMVDPAGTEYTHTRTRGYWFRANSSFTISAVKAGEGNSLGVNSTNQSIEIIQFTALNLYIVLKGAMTWSWYIPTITSKFL